MNGLSVRAGLRAFLRRVHPDVVQSVPEARKTNTVFIQEFNSLIDELECSETRLNPTVGKSLPLFVARMNGRLRPARMELPPIPPEADFLEKRQIAAALLREAATLVQTADASSVSRGAPLTGVVAPLLDKKGEGAWRKLLESEISREQTRQLLYEPAPTKAETYRRYLKEKLQFRLSRKYAKIKHKFTRKLRLQQLDYTVEEILKKRLGSAAGAAPTVYGDEEEIANRSIANLAARGYNPNFVFFAKGLANAEKHSGLRYLAGEGLKDEADVWLLENIFQALKDGKPAVPVVLGRTYAANSEYGFLEIPFNFTVEELAKFVDENVDEVRLRRQAAIDKQLTNS